MFILQTVDVSWYSRGIVRLDNEVFHCWEVSENHCKSLFSVHDWITIQLLGSECFTYRGEESFTLRFLWKSSARRIIHLYSRCQKPNSEKCPLFIFYRITPMYQTCLLQSLSLCFHIQAHINASKTTVLNFQIFVRKGFSDFAAQRIWKWSISSKFTENIGYPHSSIIQSLNFNPWNRIDFSGKPWFQEL